jgi:hypothetical protein
MKSTMLTILLGFYLATFTNAQTVVANNEGSRFETIMLENLKKLDTASSSTSLLELANSFERIGNVEKTKWQPFYYASYCYAVMASMSPEKSNIDPLTEKAEQLLLKAEELDKNNSEISCLFAMINSYRILVDPMNRFPTKGKEVFSLLGKAKAENADNPRVYLLNAMIQYRTPEAFGGGKDPAKKSVEAAIEKFNSFQRKDPLAPNWGANQAKFLLKKITSS